MLQTVQGKILEIADDIKNRGIEAVIKEGQIISHSTDGNKMNAGVDVLVHLSPEVRVDTLKKLVYGFYDGTMFSKKITC